MWRTRATRPAAMGASTIAVSMESAEDGGQVRVAMNSSQSAQKARGYGRAGDIKQAVCEGLIEEK